MFPLKSCRGDLRDNDGEAALHSDKHKVHPRATYRRVSSEGFAPSHSFSCFQKLTMGRAKKVSAKKVYPPGSSPTPGSGNTIYTTQSVSNNDSSSTPRSGIIVPTTQNVTNNGLPKDPIP